MLSNQARQLREAIDAGRKEVLAHPLYERITDQAAVITFMEHHVWAVWDFMSLLKQLQRELTCTEVPWVPTSWPRSRRLVNEIVLAEESDKVGDGYLSHFELYLAAMAQAGASVAPLWRFVGQLRDGRPLPWALAQCGAPAAAAAFVGATFGVIVAAPLHAQAAVFALTREDLIPDMFEQVIAAPKLAVFTDYLDRHIVTDAEEHGPMAMAMLTELCGAEESRWVECEAAVAGALAARRALWDGTLAAIEASA
jgi:hypothetical protein